MMRILIIIFSLLTITAHLNAQYVYTIKADSVKITNCDSAELILENHTQNIPGFLFNTGNGRTIFKRALQPIGNNMYIIGADTLQLSPNGWVQGGNAFGAPGVLGTLDNHSLNIMTNGAIRSKFDSLGGFSHYGTAWFGDNVTMDNYKTLSVGGTYVVDNPNGRYITCMPSEDFRVTSGMGGYVYFNGNATLGTHQGYNVILEPNDAPSISITNSVPSPSSTTFTFLNLRNDGPKKGVINTLDFNGEAYGGTTAVDLYLYPGKELYSGNQANTILAFDGSAQRGNVGIGTGAPSAQLHTTGSVRFAGLTQDSTQTKVLVSDANGNLYYRSVSSLAIDNILRTSLAVNGPIKAKSLTLAGAKDWPDYVFDSSYELKPLSAVESYIQKEHHLPGIPAAAEIKEQGLDVGANQAALLKKIEELTLYNIDQAKKLDEQQKKLTTQDQQLADQKTQIETLRLEILQIKQSLQSKTGKK